MQKSSFDPIANKDACKLILGSLPGDRSLEMNEYYGHTQNRFWRVIATIFNESFPRDYREKQELLLRNKIAVWDVAHSAFRPGSLDSAIRNEMPNDINGFLIRHPKIQTICFNGKKAEAMYKKYFDKDTKKNYLSMPSTSPANAGCSMDQLITEWKKMLL